MKKYESLESIRGIAALSVVFSHLLITFPIFLNVVEKNNIVKENLVNIISYTPVHLVWAGHEAVILFFILSGFVLSLSIYNGKKEKYKAYFIKRVFRIYVPYIIIMIISILSQNTFYSYNNTIELSKWIQSMWSNPFELKMLFHLLFMTGEYTHNYNTVAWSLIHELRISLIFPFVVFILLKTNWKYNVIILFFVLISSFFLSSDIPYLFKDTYYYLFFFIVGSLLAKYRNLVSVFYQKINFMTKVLLLILSISLYTFKWNFGFVINSNEIMSLVLNNIKVSDLITAVGTVMIFIFAINSLKFENMLNRSLFKFLGKISYSLYLVHTLVLLTIVHSIYNGINPFFLIVLVLVSSLLIAYLYNLFIEEPSNLIGRKISKNEKEFKKLIQEISQKKTS